MLLNDIVPSTDASYTQFRAPHLPEITGHFAMFTVNYLLCHYSALPSYLAVIHVWNIAAGILAWENPKW
jgi:hypothetical protein